MISRICKIGGPALLAAFLLSGCALLGLSSGYKSGKICPSAAVLVDTSSLTVFRQDLPNDPAGALYTVDLLKVNTDCSFDRREGETDSSLDFSFRATRAPSGDAATYSVPYYVAVTQGTRILSKKNFVVQFSFAPGTANTTFADSVGSTVIRLESGKLPYDYQILVGLQITPAQRDYNMKMGRFAQ